jgi:hypothetical protein
MSIILRTALLAPLVLALPVQAQQQPCPQDQLTAADGTCVPGTGSEGKLGGGTANIEAAKGGAAAEPNKDDAEADATWLGPNAVGPASDGQGSGAEQDP